MSRRLPSLSIIVLVCILAISGVAVADDGKILRKNLSGTPDFDTEYVSLRMLPLYVPAQLSSGELDADGIPYERTDGVVAEVRMFARPLIATYQDGPVTFIHDPDYEAFPGHGARDAFAAVSLDDGNSWKRTNISDSASRSSIRIGGKAYPGDTLRNFAASDGNKVLFVWASKYCDSGSPNYAMTDDERAAVAAHLVETGRMTAVEAAVCTDGDPLTPCLYLEDHFGVAGSQGVQSERDLAFEGYPLVGDYPYSCLWAARGVLLPMADGTSRFVWFSAERLTSGKRSVDRAEAVCVKGAGCAVTWQEDPDGVRPGHGDGPGEGWSGAIAFHQTDTWYSYIAWNDFDLVSADALNYGTVIPLVDYLGTIDTNARPKAGIPMSIPIRATDNSRCTAVKEVDQNGDLLNPYCYIDFNGNGQQDFCDTYVTVSIEVPDGGQAEPHQVDMCVTEDGRLMRGNTASTRARLSLHGYSTQGVFDRDNPDASPIDSAWVAFSYEENKGLGDICDDGDCVELTDADKRDMGKNVWYHTFDMFHPEVVSQGMMLNQPAVYPADWSDPTGLLSNDTSLGRNFYYFTEDPIYFGQAGLTTTRLYQTEISRRTSPITQDWYDAGTAGTVAFNLWKQGILRRGGPADIMGRRWAMPVLPSAGQSCEDQRVCRDVEVCQTEQVCVANEANPAYAPNPGLCKRDPLPDRCYPYRTPSGALTFDAQTCEYQNVCRTEEVCETKRVCEEGTGEFDHLANPYDYYNMVCENADGTSAWAYRTDLGQAANPRYVKGFCAAPSINVSATTILEAECGDAASCLEVFPFNDYFDDLAMVQNEGIAKVLTWQQYGASYGATPDSASNSLDDLSWENPYDMGKGHRGFLAGDMLMVMYAWTPNWKALTMANDIVNLYARRSFDGGRTFTTLPSQFLHTTGVTYSGDGTYTCEWMGLIADKYPVCVNYAAGEFEQSRNLSQLIGSSVTVLDPRYAPTAKSITEAWVTTSSLPAGFLAPGYADDIRDPSRYHMVYETGVNSAYDEGEADPLDLFYSRAVNWGDDYLVWLDEPAADCVPKPTTDKANAYLSTLTGFCNEFDALEGSKTSTSGEAALTSNPGGTFLHADWYQYELDDAGHEIGADAWFRRIIYIDDYVPVDDGGTGPGKPSKPPKK
jgi:hypothetical protein